MKRNKYRAIWLFAGIVVSICIIPVISMGWFEFGIRQPYQDFLDEEQEILPLLDHLNEEIERSIPLLPETELTERRYSGLDNVTFPPYNPYNSHGRWLSLSYSTSMESTEISTYYQAELPKLGWNRAPEWQQLSYSLFYYKGKSCLEIRLPQDQIFSIIIWHDYRSQSFTPDIPEKIIKYFEFGPDVAECP